MKYQWIKPEPNYSSIETAIGRKILIVRTGMITVGYTQGKLQNGQIGQIPIGKQGIEIEFEDILDANKKPIPLTPAQLAIVDAQFPDLKR